MSLLAQLMSPFRASPQTPPATIPTGADAGVPPAGDDSAAKMAALSGVETPEQHFTPIPQTTFPEIPRAMNPAFSQMIMQAMMGAQQQPQRPSLGSLIRGA